MQSKEKFPSSHTPFRFLAFCSTAITERERNRPVKKCKLREDQSIIIFCSCHTSSIYPCVDAMDSDAKWQIGRREAKKKRSKQKKKEEWKKSGKKGKEGKGGKGGEGTETGEGGLGWLYRSTSVWDCLWHCTACRFTVWVWSWFETFPCFQESQALYNHCTARTTSLANLWQVEFLQGEWEHSKRGIGTGNLSCQSCQSCRPWPCHDFWCKFQRRKERMRTLVRWWISQQELHSPQKTCFAGVLGCGFHRMVNSAVSKTHGTWRSKIDGNTTGMAQLQMLAASAAQVQGWLRNGTRGEG